MVEPDMGGGDATLEIKRAERLKVGMTRRLLQTSRCSSEHSRDARTCFRAFHFAYLCLHPADNIQGSSSLLKMLQRSSFSVGGVSKNLSTTVELRFQVYISSGSWDLRNQQ